MSLYPICSSHLIVHTHGLLLGIENHALGLHSATKLGIGKFLLPLIPLHKLRKHALVPKQVSIHSCLPNMFKHINIKYNVNLLFEKKNQLLSN